MMRFWKQLAFFILIMCFAGVSEAQTQDGGSGNGGQGTEQAPTGKAARRKAKQDWKEKRKQHFDDAKAKKEYNKKYNTKKTRKRMKKAEKKAKRHNEHKREFFLTRWIKKHRHHRK